jgi:phosphoribosylformimino-5-aminoimidazole carboxamide ribotide isomerase
MSFLFSHFTVIPAIDLKGGKVVRLLRGDMDQATTYGDDPIVVARRFEEEGAELIHVVDLDGAFAGEPRNLNSVERIRASVKCRLDVSGGLRSLDSVTRIFTAGADVISLGSAAFLKPELLEAACKAYPGRIYGSIDAREGRLAIKGWVETTELSIAEAFSRFRSAGVAAITFTDIARDGTQSGVNASTYAEAAKTAGMPVIASGGVATLEDIRALAALYPIGVNGVITGRALYERRFTLADAVKAAGS